MSPRKQAFSKTAFQGGKLEPENPDTVQGGEATSNYHNKSEKSATQHTTVSLSKMAGSFTKIVADT